MLNISGIHEGFVLDHIQAGMSMQIYHDLKLDKLDCTVAIIKNAKSNKMGKKDIIKVECPIEALDLDILGFIDHNITVNVIKGDRIVDKKILSLPKQVRNVIKCKNPRCVTSVEQELDQIFLLTDEEKEVYRCKYCEEKYTNPNRRKYTQWGKPVRLPPSDAVNISSHFTKKSKVRAGGNIFGQRISLIEEA